MSQYRAYPAYKDSGVEWIGQVPEHWEVAKSSDWRHCAMNDEMMYLLIPFISDLRM
jgi:hypothetical protein